MLALRAVLLSALLAHSRATVTFNIDQEWPGGLKLAFTLTPDHDIDQWTMSLRSSGTLEAVECDWLGNAQKVSDNEWQVSNLDFNGHLASGASLQGVMVVRCNPQCSDLQISDGQGSSTSSPGGGDTGGGNTGGGNTGGTNTGGSNTGSGGGGGSGTKNYGDALAKSILFYDAQRSGRLPANNPIHWRGDSALGDCVVGGWYDAGDHVKFGLPFGSTTHLLMWGLYKFKDGYEAAGQLNQGYDMIKWATDYMLGAWNPGSHELVAQIGDGGADHSFWGRPEDMTMGRPCYKVGPGKPAADLMGEWAGALAAGYLVFKDKGDNDYANKLLAAASSMYAFAKSNPGTYTSSVPNVASFYGSTGYKDEMCLGGLWLYRATNDAQYLNDAKGFHEAGTAWALSWDDKKVACQLLLYEETQNNMYKTGVEGFLHDYMPGGSVPYTPCGLAWRDKWGANRYAGNAAFVALAAGAAGINPGAANKWGVEQINYLLGDNRHDGGCFSYEIGYGSKYPRSPHHRASSCPDRPAPCSDAQRTAGGPSPQLLNGALVGGPDQGGNYHDSRDDYVMNEVAIDYNSGFHSALAAINHLKATGSVPATNNKCPCQ